MRSLGVRLTSIGAQIRGYCPVHRQTVGRDDTHPSWGINAMTGAWLCFSCHAAGSLATLVTALGGDVDEITNMIIVDARRRIEESSRDETDAIEEGAAPEPYVSPYSLSKYPLPPERMLAARDIDVETAERLSIRWDPQGKCWILPVYTFAGNLVGWQEKSTGYANNVPKRMNRTGGLFGYGLLSGVKPVIVVESPLDAARFFNHGYEAVAVCGSYISNEQVVTLARSSLTKHPTIILAFDNDDAGRKAAFFSTSRFLDAGVSVRYFNYPPDSDGKDPGELSLGELHRGIRTATVLMPMDIFCIAEKAQRK